MYYPHVCLQDLLAPSIQVCGPPQSLKVIVAPNLSQTVQKVAWRVKVFKQVVMAFLRLIFNLILPDLILRIVIENGLDVEPHVEHKHVEWESL